MKKIVFTSLFAAGLIFPGRSQTVLDSILASLHNKDLYVAPIIRGVDITVRKEKIDPDSNSFDHRHFVVSSLDSDIRELAKKYSKKIVVEKLMALLQDTTRDLYANALLYDLLENRKLGKLLFIRRAEWINNGRNICDVEHWQEYAQKQTIYIYIYSYL